MPLSLSNKLMDNARNSRRSANCKKEKTGEIFGFSSLFLSTILYLWIGIEVEDVGNWNVLQTNDA